MMNRILALLGGLMLLTAFWAGALGVRRAVLHEQTRTLAGREAPFTMESALQYRMTRMVAETGTLPRVDDKVQVPDGVVMRETYSVGAEWVYAGLASLLPAEWSFASRVRWVSAAVFCLAIPFAMLWARALAGTWWAGVIAGVVLVASPAFAVRSSGLELSRENLAIPLFTLFLWLDAEVRRRGEGVARWSLAAGAAAALALAQCTWDLTQYVTGLWIAWSWIDAFRRPGGDPLRGRPSVWMVTLMLGVAGLANPYLRAHGFLLSPVFALVAARAVSLLPVSWFRSRLSLAGLLVGILVLAYGLGHLFNENYSHFGELLTAKIRYLNMKPEDPAKLEYLQRIMWTPALNSATWALTKAYLPVTFYLLGAALVVGLPGIRRAEYRTGPVLFFSLFTLPVYVFFFRFHVFLVLFTAVAAGGTLAAYTHRWTGWSRHLAPAVLSLALSGGLLYLLLFFEASPSKSAAARQRDYRLLVKAMGGDPDKLEGNRWGRPGAGYTQLEELSAALKSFPEPGPVLANFGISASVLEQTGFPIVLHPKFETPGIRERVREFYTHLFSGTERELRDWAVGHEALYYIHSTGHLSDRDIRNSPRYMVDAVNPPPGAPVHVLENRPQDAVWFRPVYSNARYRVYRIVTPEDEAFAESMTALARDALRRGDVETARRRARQALTYHWKYEPARELLATLLSL